MWNAAGRRGDIDGSQPSHLRGLGRAVPWAAAAWLLLGALPRRPWANGAGVDASWYLALNYIHEQGVRFGREIAYTAGPLAYLFTPEPEFASGHAVLALRIAIWGLIVLAVLAAMQRFGPAPGAAVAFVLATQALLDRSPADVWQAAYMAALLSAAWAGGWAPVRLGIAGFAAGFSLLLKINEGWAATALFYVLCVSALRRHHPGRTQGIALLALPPAILFAWFALAERDLLAVFPYLWNSIETMRGYSQAMSLDGPLWQLGLTLLYGGLILSVPALSSESSWLRQPVLFCFLLSAFMGFKHAMVRQDGHADLALQKLALAGLFLLPVCAGPCLQRALLLVLSFGSAFTWFYVAQEQPWLVRFAFSRLSASGIAAAAGNLVNWEREYQQLEQLSRGARAHLRLPEEFHQRIGRETVDGFPHCVDVIRANGWKYRPRPTIESSGAYTQALDQMNAAHFLSGRAPGFTLIVWETIDGRHPFFQDAATLLALRARYRPVLHNNQALLLERRVRPLQPELTPAGETAALWDQRLSLPESAPGEQIYFAAEIRPSLYGSLRSFLLRSAPVHVRVWRRSGKENWYRTVPGLLVTPVQIRPLPDDIASLATMLHDPSLDESDPVASIAWITPRPAEFGPAIRMRWFRARWPKEEP